MATPDADAATDAQTPEYAREDLIGPQIDLQVFDVPSGDALAVEESGASAMSGNPYIAAVHVLDAMSPDVFEITISITGGGD